MKKLFALFLISIMLLSSCTGNEGNAAPPFDVLVVTTHTPWFIGDDYEADVPQPEERLDYVCKYSSDGKFDAGEFFSHETNVEVEGLRSSIKPGFCGIIDNKKDFESFYDKITNEKYEDHFPKSFFDDFFVLVANYDFRNMPFVKVDYTYDTATKTLEVSYTNRPHEGWGYETFEMVVRTVYIIPIAKKDITIDGRLVSCKNIENICIIDNIIPENPYPH